jgi:hypothetical protein
MPMQPNGGGDYVNQYTFIWDVLLPADINWMPFFNSDPGNGNDADFYVSNNGALGIGALGYSANGLIQAGTWYRVAFAANLSAGKVTFYLNGDPVRTRTGGSLRDGRHALYSERDAGPDVRLFNEGDTSGNYTHEVLLNSLFFTDRTLSADEIKALGGPTAAGIAVPKAPSIRLSAALQGSNLSITWAGQAGVKLQKATTLTNPNWQDVPGTLGASSATEAITEPAAFYRLLKQ